MPSTLASLGVGGGASTLLNGLISYWKLDEASGSRADSVGGNTLTDNNTVTQNPGKVSTAAQFTAANSESLSIADNASFDAIGAAMSLSLWVYPDSFLANNAILTKWTYATDGEWSCDTGGGGGTTARMLIAGSATDPVTNLGTSPIILAVTTWAHLVWVFDGSQTGNAARLKLYANGVLQTLAFTGTIPATIRNGTAPLRMGAWSGSLTRYWNGRMDDVKLWSRALTAAEVAEDYANGLAGRALL